MEMGRTETRTTTRRIRRWLVAGWWVLSVGLGAAIAQPINRGLVRVFVVTAVPGLWVAGICLLHHRKRTATGVLAAGLLFLSFLCLPGRAADPGRLREDYLRCLRRYEGVFFVWGGENRRGVDCSGFVRTALIDAYVVDGLKRLNPRSLRTGFDLWWHDASAQALLEGYRGMTRPLFAATSINAVDTSLLLPGDLAVLSNGCHVLAYLGDGAWIEADPGATKVIIVDAPSTLGWFVLPVRIVRWQPLDSDISQ